MTPLQSVVLVFLIGTVVLYVLLAPLLEAIRGTRLRPRWWENEPTNLHDHTRNSNGTSNWRDATWCGSCFGFIGHNERMSNTCFTCGAHIPVSNRVYGAYRWVTLQCGAQRLQAKDEDGRTFLLLDRQQDVRHANQRQRATDDDYQAETIIVMSKKSARGTNDSHRIE